MYVFTPVFTPVLTIVRSACTFITDIVFTNRFYPSVPPPSHTPEIQY